MDAATREGSSAINGTEYSPPPAKHWREVNTAEEPAGVQPAGVRHQQYESSHSGWHHRLVPNGCLDPRLERCVHSVETSQCVVIQVPRKKWHQHPCEALLLHES